MTIHVAADALTDFCAEAFDRVGCRPDEARREPAGACALIHSERFPKDGSPSRRPMAALGR